MPDTIDPRPMPDYGNPPVVETVLGVQFDRLPRMKNAHLGAFWKSLDASEWPAVADAPPIPPQFEQFDADAAWARALQLQLTQDPAYRLQIRNADEDRMIQVQNKRLLFNWLGRQGRQYPRYQKVREGFAFALDRFVQFVAEEDLGEFRPNQWEVTYLNDIHQGTVWTTPANWGFFRPLGDVPTVENLIEGESFAGEWHFVIPDQRGRLHVKWEHGRPTPEGQSEDTRDFVRVTLTARGPISANVEGTEPILEGLDLGRETIVRAFRDLMSDDANRSWGLENDVVDF